MFPLLGGLVEAGASIFNGIENRKAQADQNAANLQNQMFMANNRIMMTVEDAKRAGINPLAALGNATQSYSNITGDPGYGDSFAKAGHGLGRAIAASSPTAQRNAELENKLLEAKIANVNADTVSTMKSNSDQVTALGQPGTAKVPLPISDPRGPVIQLMQRARDWRTGEIVNIPSEKAASPLQTLAASSTNAALAGRSLSEGLWGFDTGSRPEDGVRGDVWRASQDYQNPFGFQ